MNFCSEGYMTVYEIIGKCLTIAKIIIPLILIGLGTVDFYKSVTSSKDEDLTKSAKSFIRRVIAGVVIFLIPTLILLIFDITNLNKSENSCVYECILNLKCTAQNSQNISNNSTSSTSNKTNNNSPIVSNCTIENSNCISNAIFIEK